MMTTRRAVLVATAAAALATPGAPSLAQSIFPPSPDEIWAILKGEPQDYLKMLAAVDALARVLVLRLFQMKAPGDGNLSKWFEIRRPFNTPAPVAAFAYTSSSSQIVKAAGELARPTAAKIEQALAEGGLSPGKELEKDMLRGFFFFVQIKAATDQKAVPAKQAWYCEVYPFSFFCNAAG